MFQSDYGRINSISWLDGCHKCLIQAFLKGLVYSWCKNCKDEEGTPRWFAARDLLGGDNYYWQSTPMITLYEHYREVEHLSVEDAVDRAGKAAGWLLKDMLKTDKRMYESREAFKTREYRWTGEEANR